MASVVLKIGGNQVDDPTFLQELAAMVGSMDQSVIMVHGGGKEIAELQTRLGLQPRFVEGLRVTDDAALPVVEMVLNGRVNKRLVAYLVAAGVDALGLSGIDLGLVRVEKMQHPAADLGWVGRVVSVRRDRLLALLAAGIVPVISPVSLGRDGHVYNVNADHVALAVARAVHAGRLMFVTDVPGVLAGDRVLGRLTVSEAGRLIDQGTIAGGMVPKVRAALEAVAAGVPEARIVDLAGLTAGGGTAIIH